MEVIYLKLFSFIISLNLVLPYLMKLFGFKVDKSRLSCGIIGYSGNRPADPNILKLMMMFNMERGEDGTGWAINNKIEKDTEKVSKFLSTHSMDISPDDENFTIIAHARKSSSGTKTNKELVHPFGIYKNGVEKERLDLILAMNGTLTNTEIVAKEFKIDYTQWTNSDTQVIAKAMANLGEKEYIKVIEGYLGTATLVFFTPRHPNTLMVYRDPERPIYYWQKSKDEMYISSIKEPFYSVGGKEEEIGEFESEHLCRILKGKITKSEKVNREPLKYKAAYKQNTNHHSTIGDRRKQYYEGQYENYFDYASPLIVETKVLNSKKNPHNGKGNFVYSIADRYYRNGHPIQGLLWINELGAVRDNPTEQNPLTEDEKKKINPYFFVNGYMCENEQSYNDLIKKCSDDKGNFSLIRFKFVYLSEIVEFFRYPVITIVDKKEKWILNKKYQQKILQTGDTVKVDMFLSTDEFTLKYNGEWTKTTHKEVCNLHEMKPKVIIVSSPNSNLKYKFNEQELIKRIPRERQISYLKNLIKTEKRKPVRSNYLYVLMRSDLFKLNPEDQLKSYFYVLLFDLLLREDVIDRAEHTDLVNLGLKEEYCSNDFLKSVDSKITKLSEQYDDSIKDNSSNFSEIDNSTKTIDKINLLKLDESTFTEQDVIKSIRENNTFSNREDFRNDISDGDYDNFDEFCSTWINSDAIDDILPFLEGVLLCYNSVGHINDHNLVLALDKTKNDIRKIAESYYNEWKRVFNETSESLIAETKNIIEDRIEEDLNGEESEKICKANYQELIDGLKGYINEIDTLIDPEQKTPWIEASITNVYDCIKFMERKMFLNDLKNQNEHK